MIKKRFKIVLMFKGDLKIMKYVITIVLTTLVFLLAAAPPVIADGTLAGTEITNQATATFTVGSVYNLTKNSNVNTIKVDELLNVNVTWQDTSNVTVFPGSTNQVLTYRITNTGNGSEIFILSSISTLTGDDFDPTLIGIYFDDNANGVYDPGVDSQYQPGLNDPTLSADEGITIFLLNNIPTGLNDGETGDAQLTASSSSGTGAPGDVFAGAGDGGTDCVIGLSGGSDSENGSYLVSSVSVDITKSSQVTDPFGSDSPVPGATITYSIVVTVIGTGTAQDMVIEDSIPSNTTYVENSLTLNAVSLSDGKDTDAGDVGVTTANTVYVNLGDLTDTSGAQTITFEVTIN